MLALPRRRTALALLLAALASPAWAVAHAAVHEHLERHHEEVTQAHHPASVPEVPKSGAQQVVSLDGHGSHEHEHLGPVLLRPTRNTDYPSLAALPPATSSLHVVAAEQCRSHREAAPSRASPDSSGPSDPRAPPIA